MSTFTGYYGQIVSDSNQITEVGSWHIRLTGGGMTLKQWTGGFEIDSGTSRELGSIFRERITLKLYLGNDDSEDSYVTGNAFISNLPFGLGEAVNASFRGTGPLELVNGDQRRTL